MRLPPRAVALANFSHLLMLAYITSTVLLTLNISADASSISSLVISYEHRLKVRYSRSISEDTEEIEQKESVGERNCTEAERQKKGCLAGSCAALKTSQYHTFVLCRCPSDRRGERCEERAIITDSIAAELQKGNPCKEEQYGELVQALGYERLFFTNCEKNVEPNVDDKKARRAKLKKQREKARKRKLRKRERKRNKKKNLRSLERSNSYSNEADSSVQTSVSTLDSLKILEQELKKKLKTSTKNNIRHVSEKSSSHRRRKKPPTLPTVHTPLTGPASTPTQSTQSSELSH